MSTIIVPPIRAPLSGAGVVAGTRRNAAQTAPQTATRDWYLFFDQLVRRLRRLDASVNQGPHAERIDLNPGNAPDGALWVETDRGNVVYQVQTDEDGKPIWVYLAGTMPAALADKPTDLDTSDNGLLFYGTDYAHTWRWTGAAWEYAPGDRAAGEIAWFTSDPGTGWALCDGSATTRTTAAAGTAAFTTPNLIGAYAKGAAAYTGSVAGATDPVISGGVISSAADHAHHFGPFAIAGATTGSTVNLGSAVNVANYDHAHPVEADTGGGGAHSHTVSGLAAAGGEPAHVDLLPYFRV